MMALMCLALVVLLFGHGEAALSLASYYSDHMVLQRGPQRAVIWGTADTEGDTVTAQVRGQGSGVTATVQNGVWKLKLPAITDPGPFVIDVSSADGRVTLNDVLFGDVWLCSGQSNMEFEMKKVWNTSVELQRGLTFNTIRYMRTNWVKSNTPVSDLDVMTQWTAPTEATLREFSAVCYLFAEYLQPHLNYPIGLVGSYWGGTSIEAWSPPEAIQACPSVSHSPMDCCPTEPEVLWNAKIYPLRAMTMTGALWYQGETNADHPPEYVCQQKAMFREWRSQFHQESMGETRDDFPIGYVQLAAYTDVTMVGGFPLLRWAQTANHGYSPNPDQPNVFMAVAMDLPDFTSPYDPIHPRYKQEVAERLVLGARHVAYSDPNVQFQGPFPASVQLDSAANTLTIEYGQPTVNSVEIRRNDGFEVCCQQQCDGFNPWTPAPITGHNQTHVTLSTNSCGGRAVTDVRYAWRTSPCPLRQCAVYDAVNGLPAAPFAIDLQSSSPIG